MNFIVLSLFIRRCVWVSGALWGVALIPLFNNSTCARLTTHTQRGSGWSVNFLPHLSRMTRFELFWHVDIHSTFCVCTDRAWAARFRLLPYVPSM